MFFRAAALSLAALIPALGIPVYFRTDDVHWLGWAVDHPNPLAAFDPGQNLFGYYRPVPTIAWWVLYRLFGFQPLGYQLVLGLVAALSMVPLYRIGRRYAGGDSGGFLAVLLFQAAFFPILYYVYWFSALTFGLEILFLLAALDAFTDGPERPARPFRFAILALLAGLSKQPALVILPIVASGLLWRERGGSPDRSRRIAWTLSLNLAAGVLLAVTPFVTSRPEHLGGMGAGKLVQFVRERYDFYAGQILRGPAGPLALAAAGCAAAQRWPVRARFLFPLAGGLLGLFLLLVNPSIGLLVWTLGVVAAAIVVPGSIPWVMGFLVPAVLLLGVDFHVATYLLEPAAMLSVALLLWTAPLLQPGIDRIRGLLDANVSPALATLLPLLLSAALLSLAWPRVTPVRTMREVRAVFREAVDFLVEKAPRGAVVGSPSYDEMGETYAVIRERPLGERVEQHKTMNPAQLEKFLRLRGRGDIKVRPIGETGKAGPPRMLLALNSTEAGFLSSLPGARRIQGLRAGKATATIYEWLPLSAPPDSVAGR